MHHKRSLCLLFPWIIIFSLISCKKKEAPMQMPPPQVLVIKTEAKDVPYTPSFVGQTAGSKDIEVRARVSGILLKRMYVEGQRVNQGDVLFLIDPEPYKVALDQARATHAQAQATYTKTKLDRDRVLPLFKANALSKKDRDQAVGDFNVAKANLEAAKARVEEAEINLGYTTVTAPISGLTSKEAVSEGSLISTSETSSLLTRINQLDPIYVNFSYSDSEALKLRKDLEAGSLSSPPQDDMEVELKLSDGSTYPSKGKMNFSDNHIDTVTGTLRVRGELPNPDAALLPGQFVRVSLHGYTRKKAILIPQRAVIQQPDGKVAFIVNKESKIEPRPIILGDEVGNQVVVEKGISAGENVVVEGVLKARPGTPVKMALAPEEKPRDKKDAPPSAQQ